MAKQSTFNNTIKYFTLALILMTILFPMIKADICNDSFEHYKDYIRDTLINSFDEIKNDSKWLNSTITYDNKILVKKASYDVSNLEINITSGINFSEINLLNFLKDPMNFTLSHLRKMEVNNEPFNISDESFDAYYSIFRNTTFFNIIKGLNVTHINFKGTEYKIDSNKENIKNIIKSSNVINYLGEDPENFTLEFTIKIDDGNGGCKKDVNLDFKFLEKSIQVDAMIGFHNILVNAEFEKDSVRVSFEYEDIIFLVNTKLDEHDIIIKGEFAEKITNFKEDEPVVVDSPNSIVNITIPEDVTEVSTIDISNLISSGKGDVPKIIVTASNANNIVMNIPATKINSSNTSWDGIIQVPTLVDVSIPEARGKTRTQSIAIKVGSESGTLTFEKSVKLVFPGEAGKNIAFFTDGEFNEINTICSSNDQSWANDKLGPGKDCYINDGSDLVVWTKHFTEFVTYTEASSKSLIGEGVCVTEWECSEWTSCTNGIQTRICSYPSNFCKPTATKPTEMQTCVSDNKEILSLNDNIKTPDSNIRTGLGLGAVIGNMGGSIYWIILALIIIIITLIIILIRSSKRDVNTKAKEVVDTNNEEPPILEPEKEDEKEDLDLTKEVKPKKSKTKKSQKPKSSVTKK